MQRPRCDTHSPDLKAQRDHDADDEKEENGIGDDGVCTVR
jgi:hypothetical protein